MCLNASVKKYKWQSEGSWHNIITIKITKVEERSNSGKLKDTKHNRDIAHALPDAQLLYVHFVSIPL